ncbi:MAG: hypothetical protein ACE5WD_01145 [Candidatus Aminicenantia bacterium]
MFKAIVSKRLNYSGVAGILGLDAGIVLSSIFFYLTSGVSGKLLYILIFLLAIQLPVVITLDSQIRLGRFNFGRAIGSFNLFLYGTFLLNWIYSLINTKVNFYQLYGIYVLTLCGLWVGVFCFHRFLSRRNQTFHKNQEQLRVEDVILKKQKIFGYGESLA